MHVVEKNKDGLVADEAAADSKEVGEKKRVSTGCPQLDLLIGGGFPKGRSYLIAGDSGTGKTIFATAFVLKGLMEGEKAVYVSVDDKPSDIVEQAASLGWDLTKYISEKQLLMLDASPFFTGSASGKEVDVAKTVVDLASYVTRLGATRVVIDPVGPLVPSRDSGKRVRDGARALIRSLREHLGTTNLLVLPSATSGAAGEWEDYPVAGVIVLKLSQTPRGLARSILVRKMRATAVELTEYPFRIVNGKGLVIETSVPVVAPPAPAETENSQPKVVLAPSSEESGNAFEVWAPVVVEEEGKGKINKAKG